MFPKPTVNTIHDEYQQFSKGGNGSVLFFDAKRAQRGGNRGNQKNFKTPKLEITSTIYTY